MPARNPPTIDFSELRRSDSDGETFQNLCTDLFRALGHRVEPSGRGADGGRDLYLYELVSTDLLNHQRKWLVQCKDFALDGRAVGSGDVGSISDACLRHQVDAYLLLCTTTVTVPLSQTIEQMTAARDQPYFASFLNGDRLRIFLAQPAARHVLQSYLPLSFARLVAAEGSLLREYLSAKGVPEAERSALVDRVDAVIATVTRPSEPFPWATEQRQSVDRATQLFRSETFEECAEEMESLHFEEWSALLIGFLEEDYDSALELAEFLAHSHEEPRRYWLVTTLTDADSGSLRDVLRDVLPFMRQLSTESLELIAERFQLERLIQEAVDAELGTRNPSGIDDLPNPIIESVSVVSIEYTLDDGNCINADVELSFSVVEGSGDEDASSSSYPGRALVEIFGTEELQFRGFSVDTSSFFDEPDDE